MADKKEVVDYLRNRQKAAEIEAKVNGINLWVLLGAIGLVCWQLSELLNSSIWAKHEIVLRVLLCSQTAYLFFSFCSPSRGTRDELRFSTWHFSTSGPLLMLVEGVILVLPAAMFFVFVEKASSALVLLAFGVIYVAFTLQTIVEQVRGEKAAERFPRSPFGSSSSRQAAAELVFGGVFLIVFASQAWALLNRPPVPVLEFKTFALVGVLYMLSHIAIARKRHSGAIQWTYDLETDLIVGAQSPEEALRHIEHRALGPRFQDIVESFFEGLDQKFDEFDNSLDSGLGKLKDELINIPSQYAVERSARVKSATEKPNSLLAHCDSEIAEFTKYLNGLLARRGSDKRVAQVIGSLVEKKKTYIDRLKASRRQLESAISEASR
jgi:hypothetical protein